MRVMLDIEKFATYHHIFSISKVNLAWVSWLAETEKNGGKRKIAVVHNDEVGSTAGIFQKDAGINAMKLEELSSEFNWRS